MTRRTSPPRRHGVAGLAAVVAAIVVTSMPGAPSSAAVANRTRKPKAVVTMIAGERIVYGVADEPASLPDDVRDRVMSALAAYVKGATVKPLRRGRAGAAKLTRAMTPGVVARLRGADRDVLLDEVVPKAVRKIVVTAAPTPLFGLADAEGRMVLVVAQIDTTATTRTAKGKLTITRQGEVELVPVESSWKISGYTLTVERTGKGVRSGTTSTVPQPSSTTTTR